MSSPCYISWNTKQGILQGTWERERVTAFSTTEIHLLKDKSAHGSSLQITDLKDADIL